MPLQRMAILRGRPIQSLQAGEPSPHYQVLVNACGVNFRAAINARSFDGSEVEYLRKDITGTSFVAQLKKSIRFDGCFAFEGLAGDNNGDKTKFALDYIRSGLIAAGDGFQKVPYSKTGVGNDLNEYFEEFFQPLKTYGAARVYVIGQVWGPDTAADDYFGFLPGAGIHDIHMNQGNPENGDHGDDNGTYQDGALIVQLPRRVLNGVVVQPEKWEAIFIKFATQSMSTDDQTGHPKPSPVA